MSKYDVLVDVAKKISALDNDVKLKILALLIEEGSKSITDISKELNINFSTAHKYLEQLEAACLVASKEVSENRLKRLFTIKDFDIALSPKGISELINGKNGKETKKSALKVLNEAGELAEFDEKLFAQKYLKRGMPQGIIANAMNLVMQQAYDGITLLEMRRIFQWELESRTEKTRHVFEQIEESDKHKTTFTHLLEMIHPEALDMHANGDIFIRNLCDPRLLKFSHDIRAVYLHGGIEGKKKAKEFGELLEYINGVINAVCEFTQGSQILDSFNYFVAPTVGETFTQQNIVQLRKFLDVLNEKCDRPGMRFYIGLDMGLPKWAGGISPYYFTEERKLIYYNSYEKVAQTIAKECLKYMQEKKYDAIRFVLKVWDKNFELNKSVLENIPTVLVANMSAPWQTINASYSSGTRFDARWKNWMRTVKVGEIQNITINLPRLAHDSNKDASEFFKKLDQRIKQTIDWFNNMATLVPGEFLKYKTSFKSAQKERWDCAHIEDSTYFVSVLGLDETVYLLTGKRLPENIALAEKILQECQKFISKYNKLPIRVELKEEIDIEIAKRFYKLDSKRGVPVKSYTAGANCADFRTAAKLHKYLLGGHCVKVSKKEFDFKTFVKCGGGLARLT